jgi:hypothetical protein
VRFLERNERPRRYGGADQKGHPVGPPAGPTDPPSVPPAAPVPRFHCGRAPLWRDGFDPVHGGSGARDEPGGTGGGSFLFGPAETDRRGPSSRRKARRRSPIAESNRPRRST